MPHATPFPSGNPDPVKNAAERDTKRLNFIALVVCLMVGTAALPHILMRYYTTPSVKEARESVTCRCSSSSCCTSQPRRWPCW